MLQFETDCLVCWNHFTTDSGYEASRQSSPPPLGRDYRDEPDVWRSYQTPYDRERAERDRRDREDRERAFERDRADRERADRDRDDRYYGGRRHHYDDDRISDPGHPGRPVPPRWSDRRPDEPAT